MFFLSGSLVMALSSGCAFVFSNSAGIAQSESDSIALAVGATKVLEIEDFPFSES